MKHFLNLSKKALLFISFILLSISSFSQCSDCNNSIVIPKIPFTDANTTCGKCDNFNQGDGCSGLYASYLNGDDVVYTYTPSTLETLDFVLSDNDNYTGIFIMDGCPTSPSTNCVAKFASISGNVVLGGVTLNPGTTYYIIISSDAPPQCVNYTLNIFPNTPSSACNADIIGNTCATATSICNSNGYCGTTGSNTIDTWPELTSAFGSCTNFAIIHNNSFLQFVADSSTAVFSILIDNCIGGNQLQAMIFDNVCSGPVTSYSCYGEINAASQTQTFFASGLTPGNTYKIMIDGEGGATCDYNIKAISGVAVSSVLNTVDYITICEGDNTILTATGNAPFLWFPGGETTQSIVVSPTSTTVYAAYSNGPCGNVSDTIVITVISEPNAGADNSINLCSNSTPINLTDSLGGTPNTGGNWIPSLVSGSGIFDPAIDAAGTYTYTVNACGGGTLTADVVVTVNPSPNTGADGTLTICPTDPSTDLFGQLGGIPDAGGTWSPAMNSGTGVFDPTIDAAGTYTYSVTNYCGTSSNDVVVTITANPDPGTNGTAIICSNGSSINLLDSLNGTPDAGGTWSPSLISGTGIFDPSVDAAGTYTYSVNACGGGTLTADVVVTVNPAPNAGIDGALSICSSDPAVDLFNSLTGSPDAGGTWSPAMNSGTGVFDPTIDAAGIYTYTLFGTSSCIGTTNLSVNIIPPPIANFTTNSEDGNSISFTNLSTGAINYEWTIDNFLVLNDVHPYYTPTKLDEFDVQLIAFSSEGCSDTIQDRIKVNEEPLIYIPNAFSPNDDGVNDIFKVSGIKLDDFNLYIFNRWGELIFKSNDISEGWDGKYKGIIPEQTETYVWKIQYTSHSNIINKMHGTVTLLK